MMPLNVIFLRKVLSVYIALQKTEVEKGLNVGRHLWEIKRAEQMLEDLESTTPTPLQLVNEHGGRWLGYIHEHIQHHYLNGDRVGWGSNDNLIPNRTYTVRELELLAAKIAYNALSEFRGR